MTSDATGLLQQAIPKTSSQPRLVIKDTIEVKGKQVPWETELSIKTSKRSESKDGRLV